MRQREESIKIWFDMWLGEDITPLDAIFAKDVTYVECWGYVYVGQGEIRRWFEDWHGNNRMLVWEPKQFIHEADKTVVTWHMEAEAKNGTPRHMDGVYIIEWNEHEQICLLEEYSAVAKKTRPYEK